MKRARQWSIALVVAILYFPVSFFSIQAGLAKDCLSGALKLNDRQNQNSIALPELEKIEPRLDYRSPAFARQGPPAWIRKNVYSNDSMIMRVCKRVLLPFFGRTIKSEIPDYTDSPLTVKSTVLANWKGEMPSQPCRVTCTPYGPPGNFRFTHSLSSGPRGYLEKIGRDTDGFMTYRYWFDEPLIISQRN